MTDAIRVFIVDDHAVVRQGLRAFLELESDVEVVGEASEGAEAVARVAELLPDVVLMDLVMRGMDGIEATRQIRATCPTVQVLVLTSFAEDEKVFPAVKAGALGYLMKDVSPDELRAGIRAVHRGEPLLHPDVARKLMQEFARPRFSPTEAPLTEREIEVLRLVAKGLSNREIAEALVVSEKTVKTHVSSILSKLHLRDRLEAALWAYRTKVAEPPS